jgi:cytochrome P450
MKLPDGPRTPPLLQQIRWITQSIEFLDDCARRYGDPFTARVFGSNAPPVVFLSNPQAIQAIYTASPHQFESGRVNGIFRPVMGEHSVIVLDGARHQRLRQLLMPPFHGDRMRTYGQLISDITQQVTGEWATTGKPFSIRASMQNITLQVILRTVFGLDEGEHFQQLKQLLNKLLESITSPLYSSMFFFPTLQRDLGAWSPWGDFVRQRQQIDNLIYAEISQRRSEPNCDRTDILTLLMAARDPAGQPLTDVELRDELITLLMAGHETTASALAWAFYWIHQQPEVLDQLMRELEELGDADASEIARLPYLTAVCQETLRIYPIALISLPRILKSPIELMDYQFEAGTILVPCIYLAHRREDRYPEPHQFDPERFLKQKFSPYEYLPFGGGSRGCIGFAFALFEMKLILATVLSRFRLALAEQRPVRPVRRGITTSPSGGVRMVVTVKRGQGSGNLR